MASILKGLTIIDLGLDNDDGLSNVEEIYFYSTNVNDPDTDSDILSDYEEINTFGTNPIDANSDDDGIIDGYEITNNINPNNEDCDSDGLLNGAEVLTYGTNPLSTDTVVDSMPEGWEVQYQLDSTVYIKDEDSDTDELTNYEEFLIGIEPKLADTVFDDFNDSVEFNKNTDPLDPNDYSRPSWWDLWGLQVMISMGGSVADGIFGLLSFLVKR